MKINLLIGAMLLLPLVVLAGPDPAQSVPSHLPRVVSHLSPTGRLDPGRELPLVIGLPLRHQEELTNLLHRLYDPADPEYRHYLAPGQFAERFSPTREDYDAVKAFAKASGLRVRATHPNRMLLDVSGSVSNIERAFQVSLRTYAHPQEKRMFYAADREPSVALSVPLLQINGLDNYSLPRPRLKTMRPAKTAGARPQSGSGVNGAYMGYDFRAAYVPGLPLTGAGQTVGLLEFDGYTTADIAYYESNASLPNVTLTNVFLDGFDGLPSGDGSDVEVALDIEVAISMAPGLSQVMVYEGKEWHDILNRMATDDVARQLSCSWYTPNGGPDPVADQIWQQMAAQGQSFFNASGDSCAYSGPIDFPGDSPYITQVGGTTLTTTGPGGSWKSETVWNWGGGVGSSGGVSTSYSIPSWQTGIDMSANEGSSTLRNTPDVALTADNVYVRATGEDFNAGGTSCAAPLWAGFMALVNQQAVANGRPAQGFANPALYTLGQEAGYTLGFHDITTGNNESPTSPDKFPASPGFDLCTGWGTPNGSNLVNALVAPTDPLQITPGLGFIAVGPPGGPFTPSSQTYFLKNTHLTALNWGLAGLPSWLTASTSGGQLNGASVAAVSIGLNSAAAALPVGTNAATLYFTNLNDGFVQSRQFFLQVAYVPVSLTRQPSNQTVMAGGTATFGVAATGSKLAYRWQKNGSPLTDGGHIAGAATSVLTVLNASTPDAAIYACIVSNALGAATSTGAGLTVDLPGGGQLVQNGGFETGDFSDWTLSGNTNQMFVTTNAAAVHSGDYGVQSGADGSSGFLSQTLATTPGAAYLISLWVNIPADAAPNEVKVEWGGGVVFDAANLPAVAWTNLEFLVTATNPATVLALGLRDDPNYLGLDDVIVTGYTNDASPPWIVAQPASQVVPRGGNATFSVSATGTGPLGYYWERNGSPIAGATQSTYTDTMADADAGAQFSCLVSNLYGMVLSSTAVLTVAGPLHYFTGPDGGFPAGALVQTADGTFYGTTEYGGANGFGTVFKLATNGTLTTLVEFKGYDNGLNPTTGLILGADGNLYGTTSSGGTNYAGTVFKLTTNGLLTTLVAFNYTDGQLPAGSLVQGTDGNFYGTTEFGGANGAGTVFKMAADGALTTLASFYYTNGTAPNGGFPTGALVQDSDGNFYGTTEFGGVHGLGTVFRIAAANGMLTTLVSFDSDNGANPTAGLVQGADGSLYGTTKSGGTSYNGTVFKVTTSGTLTTLVSLDYTNGALPVGGLLLTGNGNLYGTTTAGGNYGFGNLFCLAPDGTLTTVFSLAGINGAGVQSALIQGLDGNLYGTTVSGGAGFNGYTDSGGGTVFGFLLNPAPSPATPGPPAIIAQPWSQTISADGTATFTVQAEGTAPLQYFWRLNGSPLAGATQASYTITKAPLADSGAQFSCLVSNTGGTAVSSNALLTLVAATNSGPVFSFSGSDGGMPVAGLLETASGNLYGTTEYGGSNGGYGTLFVTTTNGVTTTLVSFAYTNGAYPEAALMLGQDGNLYGTTAGGGYEDQGTLFKVTTNGQLTTLLSFAYGEGYAPVGSLVQDSTGNLYGTTSGGGPSGAGTVFEYSVQGELSTLVSFDQTNGGYPAAGLLLGQDGNLYGATQDGGWDDAGTVFKLTTNGLLTELVVFDETNGAYPGAGLVQGNDGALYGTTEFGGEYYGTVFRVTTNGAFSTVAALDYETGAYPYSALVLGADGNFYGTTEMGGDFGSGTVFCLSPDGTLLTNIYSFANTNGSNPEAGLTRGPDGNLYGTTSCGGPGGDGESGSGNGVIFRAAVAKAPPAVPTPPVITTQPVSETEPVGGTASFGVVATGALPLVYYWQLNGTPIAGATNASYTTNDVQLTGTGSQYSCLVSNLYGTTTSSIALLTVLPNQPGSNVLVNFDNFALSVGTVAITNGYHGLAWSNFYVLNAVEQFLNNGASGYYYGMVTASNVAYNAYGLPATISASNTFDFDSAYATAAWEQGLQLETLGYNGSTLLYSNTYTLRTNSPTLINFNYVGVTEVYFASSYSGSASDVTQFVLDNVTIGTGAPASPTLDHFAWNTVPSPQGAAQSFAVTITAQSASGQRVGSFGGTAALTGAIGGTTSNLILGAPPYEYSSSGNWTLGYAFTPSTNITVTEVLSCFGTSVSIWTAGGTLLASQAVTSAPGTWLATPLVTPLTLAAGTQYVVSDCTGGGTYYWSSVLPSAFANGTIDQNLEIAGNAFPTNKDTGVTWLVDLGYTVGATLPVTVAPAVTGSFMNGVWTGRVAVPQDATHLVLTANDGAGHVGSSNPINVVPGLGINAVSGGFQISIAGSPGEVYQVLASTNLVTWQTIGRVTNITGTVQFTDPSNGSFGHRFYIEAIP